MTAGKRTVGKDIPGENSPEDTSLREALETFRQLRDEFTRDYPLAAHALPAVDGPLSDLFALLVEQPADPALRREAMIARIRAAWRASGAILDPKCCEAVLDAMSRVPREAFVPEEALELAYLPTPLSIGHDQTISDPLIVATLALAIGSSRTGRVLDVGTGCGYQAAVLSLIYDQVVSIEIIPELACEATARLSRLGYGNVEVLEGDAITITALSDTQRFDAVVVAAGSPAVPPALLRSLDIGGRLIAPVGPAGGEQLIRVSPKSEHGFARCSLGPARFVPLRGVAARTSVPGGDLQEALPECFGAPVLTTRPQME